MVVCKFFLQGNCRFGEGCKFEHQYNDNRQQHGSILRQQSFNPSGNNNIPGQTVDTSTLIRSVIKDMSAIEKGGQWLLSCYAPFKEKAAFPSFEDFSFEEIRLGYYTAKANGTLDAYIQQLNALLQEAMMRIRSLQNPTPDSVTILRNIYDQPATAGSFSNTPIFGGTQTPSIFSNTTNTTNIFAQSANTAGNENIFNKTVPQQNSSAQSIFAAANQSLFRPPQQPPAFSSTANQSIFGNSPSINSPLVQTFQPDKSAFQQVPDKGFSSGSFAQPFSSTNLGQFGSTVQNPLPFLPSAAGTSIFNVPSSNTPSNSPLMQQQNAAFNGQAGSIFSNSSGSFANTQVSAQMTSNLPPPSNVNIFNSNLAVPAFSGHSLNAVDESAYSKLEDLSESDIKSYQAETFEFGKVPEKPPHISMC